MNKPLLVYQAPVSTRSGYGDHARDLLRSFRDLDMYDIKIVSTRWGVTPMDQLSVEDEFSNWILTNIIPSVPQNTDIFVQMTVPNEFQKLGKVSIGVTAGIETTLIPKDWVDGCNRMDFVIATSNHTRDTILNTVYQERRSDTNQIVAEYRVQKPIFTLFEGIDYVKTDGLEMIDNIEEDFCFLFVGHWLSGDLYHDRKDVGGLIQMMLASFGKSKGKKPALILKTSMAGFSIRDREEIQKKIDSIKQTVPGSDLSIYLLHGDLSQEEMWKLYNHPKIKTMVSFTHGEGFGRPLLEFSLTGKPVMASNWSGHTDFLGDGAVMFDGELKNVHESAANQFILKESKWFHVDYSKAAIKLIDIFNNYNRYLTDSKKLADKNSVVFSHKAMTSLLKEICEQNVKVVKQVQLQLPKLPTLSKVEPPSTFPKLQVPKLPTLSKVEPPAALPKLQLPKLKKVE